MYFTKYYIGIVNSCVERDVHSSPSFRFKSILQCQQSKKQHFAQLSLYCEVGRGWILFWFHTYVSCFLNPFYLQISRRHLILFQKCCILSPVTFIFNFFLLSLTFGRSRFNLQHNKWTLVDIRV